MQTATQKLARKLTVAFGLGDRLMPPATDAPPSDNDIPPAADTKPSPRIENIGSSAATALSLQPRHNKISCANGRLKINILELYRKQKKSRIGVFGCGSFEHGAYEFRAI